MVIAFVFIDLLGYSLFLPLLPFYAGALGASPTLVGLLVASNALVASGARAAEAAAHALAAGARAARAADDATHARAAEAAATPTDATHSPAGATRPTGAPARRIASGFVVAGPTAPHDKTNTKDEHSSRLRAHRDLLTGVPLILPVLVVLIFFLERKMSVHAACTNPQ